MAGSHALPVKDQQALRKLVTEHGEKKTCEILEIASATLARALAGMPLARTTVTHVQTKIGGAAKK